MDASSLPGYPISRPRRLRLLSSLRDIVAEAHIPASSLMLPIFISERHDKPQPIDSLPGHYYYPPASNELISYIQEALDHGIKSFLIFGYPKVKDEKASRAYASDGPVQVALRNIRRELGYEPVIATDLCICNYHISGHCGLPGKCRYGECVDNDGTLKLYQKIAVSQAEAGTDIIAPSGMMDGQVKAIREILDENGYWDTAIMAYSAKYASNFYGPFREVLESAPKWGDRRSYQADPRNAKDALVEVALDIKEGADIVMVKPALAYLDIIRLVKTQFPYVPLAAYNVSGEYMLVELMAKHGYADKTSLMVEIVSAIRRAGADIVITYHALDIVKLQRGG
ncbi:MAG: porphobilinogen synthase [Desulfurococcales archaeon]|nr:porphobilinogen synthase [Desulfurococcales archaeon]